MICPECGQQVAAKAKKIKKCPPHVYNTGTDAGYFTLVAGKRVSHTVFCACGDRKDVPVDTEIQAAGPKVFGLSSGERVNK